MRLNYQVVGQPENTAVVLLHGLFGMSDNLITLAKMLASEHWVIVPDLINHGRSPHMANVTYASMAEDVLSLIDSLDIAECLLLGHSMGGKVSMAMAELAPDRIKRMIIADIAPVDYEPRHLDIIEQMQKVKHLNTHKRQEVDDVLAEKVPEKPLRQFFMKNMARDDEGFWRWRFGLDEIAASYSAICASPQLTHAFIPPVLFIIGQQSNYVLPEHKDRILALYPNAKVRVVTDAGHWLHAEKPQVFNQIVYRFFNSILT
ncbi:MAG: alpha/beta fold hydrolase [Cellvibrionales bacterium]|nr:alpha/beta fold hydrolase [Cellvibrionales bacterium]